MNLDWYNYLFDLGWFFLTTCAAMVSTAALIVLVEDVRGGTRRDAPEPVNSSSRPS